jgi:hypothetical protein
VRVEEFVNFFRKAIRRSRTTTSAFSSTGRPRRSAAATICFGSVSRAATSRHAIASRLADLRHRCVGFDGP